MPAPNLSVIGASGLHRQGGRVYEEYLRELSGDRWHRVVQEMQDDAVIGAVLFAIEMLIRQVEWAVSPADDSQAALDQADFVHSALHDMELTWPDTLAEILTMLPWGYAYFELVYKLRSGESDDPTRASQYNDNRVGWRRWAIRSQDTLDHWEFDDEGRMLGLWQSPPPDYRLRYIPLDKALHFRTSARKGNPEGRSLLRAAYRSFYMKKNIENIEGIGIERDLAGLPVAHVPQEVLLQQSAETQAVYNAIRDIVTNIRRDEQEGVIWPLAYDANGKELYRLELLSTGGTRQFDTDKIISRYNAQMAMSVLADFIMLGTRDVGSYALSSSKTDLFATALGAWLDSICATVNNKAIPVLLRLNGLDLTLAPSLTHGDIESADLGQLGAYVTALTGGGVMFDEDEQRWLKEQAGIPVSSS